MNNGEADNSRASIKRLWQAVQIEPAANLQAKILSRIERLQARRAQVRLGVLASALVAAVSLTAVAFIALWQEFLQSGMLSLIDELFYDAHSMLANWQEFGYSLLESLPVAYLVAALAGALVVLFLVRALGLKLSRSHKSIHLLTN